MKRRLFLYSIVSVLIILKSYNIINIEWYYVFLPLFAPFYVGFG